MGGKLAQARMNPFDWPIAEWVCEWAGGISTEHYSEHGHGVGPCPACGGACSWWRGDDTDREPWSCPAFPVGWRSAGFDTNEWVPPYKRFTLDGEITVLEPGMWWESSGWVAKVAVRPEEADGEWYMAFGPFEHYMDAICVIGAALRMPLDRFAKAMEQVGREVCSRCETVRRASDGRDHVLEHFLRGEADPKRSHRLHKARARHAGYDRRSNLQVEGTDRGIVVSLTVGPVRTRKRLAEVLAALEATGLVKGKEQRRCEQSATAMAPIPAGKDGRCDEAK